ncbi:MAG TPA: LytTR family DNA-binding domain-containing protein [Allosphingosinicella sp.]|nr:LytTR family DNA-binding domain-containing protein [Allosphingosinicella sp.]
MLTLIKSPLPPLQALSVASVLVLVTAFYCVAYTHYAGQAETLPAALAWGIANLLPWYLAFELGKRLPGWPLKASALGGALLASLALQQILLSGLDSLAFELLRRLPGLALAAALLAAPRLAAALPGRPEAEPAALAPELDRVDWIRAAGNYVELHGGGHSRVERAALSALESELAPHGFVRIHRSLLVRRDRIARLRPLDVVMADGTVLKLGKRYRSRLQA